MDDDSATIKEGNVGVLVAVRFLMSTGALCVVVKGTPVIGSGGIMSAIVQHELLPSAHVI